MIRKLFIIVPVLLSLACGLASAPAAETPTAAVVEPVETQPTETVTQPQVTNEAVESAQITTGGAEELVTLQGNKDAAIYSFMAVNNSHFAAFDGQGRLRVVYTDGRTLTLMTRGADGAWMSESVPVTGTQIKSPSIVFANNALHVAWMEGATGSSMRLGYASGSVDAVSGAVNWQAADFGALALSDPQNSIKYLTFAVSNANALFGFTEGTPDVYARFASTLNPASSALTSGLGTLQKSSDITLAAEGDLALRVWEENWDGYGRGQEAHLVYEISRDGGSTWSALNHLLTHETLGGDPSVCITNGAVYVAWQQTLMGSGGIYAAVMPAGASQFQPILFDGQSEPGRVGDGWLVNASCAGGTLALSWEYTKGEYHAKSEHAVASAYILNADSAPQVIYGAVTDASPTDATFDLNSNILLSPDGSQAEVFWATVTESNGKFIFVVKHRTDVIAP